MPRWTEHAVIPGERLAEIAKRYGVEMAKLLEWNDLDPKKIALRAGQRLRIWTTTDVPTRRYRAYKVRTGDNWTTIAKRYHVDADKLRRVWNAGHGELRPGERIAVWVEGETARDGATAKGGAASFDFDFGADADAALGIEQDDGEAEDDLDDEVDDSDSAEVVAAPRARSAATFVAAVRRDPPKMIETERRADDDLPIITVPKTALSVGRPSRGRLPHGLQMPENAALYTLRNLAHSWGASHMIEELQRGIALFRRATGFDRQILIADMSHEGGGRFNPHHSHMSGRDVDIQLPTKKGVRLGIIPTQMNLVDWDATWGLVKAMIATGEVKYIFLSRSRQVELYRAAKRAKASDSEIAECLQYPNHAPKAIVRHSSGHVKHIHVRFNCASYETQCSD
jgi:murein DD-endopeptidase MepM/ murein hydrolase activator NlpD